LFGFRVQALQVPLTNRAGEINSWLLRQDEPNEPWSSLWKRCQRVCRSCFKEIWIVRLPRRSRSLQRGDYAFDPLTDFLRIPGNPPQVVEDCYQEAFAELPRHRFVYLDLLWDTTPTGLQLVSIERLRATNLEQEQQFKRRLRTDRNLIAAAQARVTEALKNLKARGAAARTVQLPSTPTEARRILGLSYNQLLDSLQLQIAPMRFTKFDPVIVFEEPGLLARAYGHMPLGLIAHWD
jgi:hypothetical protein